MNAGIPPSRRPVSSLKPGQVVWNDGMLANWMDMVIARQSGVVCKTAANVRRIGELIK